MGKYAGIIILICVGIFASRSALDAEMALPSTASGEEGAVRPAVSVEAAGGDVIIQRKIQDVGNIMLMVSNYGFFGNNTQEEFDETDGHPGFIGCRFPAGSRWDYLFQGALWIGAIVGDDTLVSVGHDGWSEEFEFFPGKSPGDTLVESSLNHLSPYSSEYLRNGADAGHGRTCANKFEPHPYDPAVYNCIFDGTAVSELDFAAVYTDTMLTTDHPNVSPNHTRPLNLRIKQRSYAWSYPYAEDFIIFDYEVENTGIKLLKQVYLALYLDGDCGPTPVDNSATIAQDDITGFREEDETGKNISVAWIADHVAPGGDDVLAPSVMGVRVVRTPEKYVNFNFNWWLSDGEHPENDWGPGPRLPSGTSGTPMGDVSKYLVMCNWMQDDNDPDQLDALKSGQPVGPEDTRFLLSTGPFTIQPGQMLPITIGYFCAENFYLGGDKHKMDFSYLDLNARWVQFIYDNPAVDTDGDGFYGEDTGCDGLPFTGDPGESDGILQNCEDLFLPAGLTDRYGYANGVMDEGDGVPDFEGPPPPVAPKVRVEMGDNEVILKWNSDSEGFLDTFIPELTKQHDFQGYRVYMSTTGVSTEFTKLGNFDMDKVLQWYMKDTIDGEGNPTEVIRYHLDGYGDPDYMPDSLGFNTGFADIRNNDPDSTEYAYRLTYGPVRKSWPLFFSVTAYDNGYPPANLPSLESSKLTSRVSIVPFTPAEYLDGRKAYTVPNPYRFDRDYKKAPEAGSGWEPEEHQWSEFNRRIDFVDLPGNCTIRIFTMAGDLVETLRNRDGDTIMSWDLLSRNGQTVAAGLYFFVVEPDGGGDHQVGKLVIIK